jgi:hypothetical protein
MFDAQLTVIGQIETLALPTYMLYERSPRLRAFTPAA